MVILINAIIYLDEIAHQTGLYILIIIIYYFELKDVTSLASYVSKDVWIYILIQMQFRRPYPQIHPRMNIAVYNNMWFA